MDGNTVDMQRWHAIVLWFEVKVSIYLRFFMLGEIFKYSWVVFKYQVQYLVFKYWPQYEVFKYLKEVFVTTLVFDSHVKHNFIDWLIDWQTTARRYVRQSIAVTGWSTVLRY